MLIKKSFILVALTASLFSCKKDEKPVILTPLSGKWTLVGVQGWSRYQGVSENDSVATNINYYPNAQTGTYEFKGDSLIIDNFSYHQGFLSISKKYIDGKVKDSMIWNGVFSTNIIAQRGKFKMVGEDSINVGLAFSDTPAGASYDFPTGLTVSWIGDTLALTTSYDSTRIDQGNVTYHILEQGATIRKFVKQ